MTSIYSFQNTHLRLHNFLILLTSLDSSPDTGGINRAISRVTNNLFGSRLISTILIEVSHYFSTSTLE
jgi:hypothetical protein